MVQAQTVQKRPLKPCTSAQRPLSRDVIGEVVRVHKNLHNGCYAVSDPRTRKVLGYTPALVLRDVRPHVSKAGHRRCMDQGVRNVHAFLEGTLASFGPESRHFDDESLLLRGWRKLTYNCLTGDAAFHFRDDDSVFVGAERVVLLPGAVFAEVGPR